VWGEPFFSTTEGFWEDPRWKNLGRAWNKFARPDLGPKKTKEVDKYLSDFNRENKLVSEAQARTWLPYYDNYHSAAWNLKYLQRRRYRRFRKVRGYYRRGRSGNRFRHYGNYRRRFYH